MLFHHGLPGSPGFTLTRLLVQGSNPDNTIPQTPVVMPLNNESSSQALVTPLNATPPSVNQTSAQHKKVKYYNLSISDEEKEETVLFLMDKFTVFLNRLKIHVKVYFSCIFHLFFFYSVLSLLKNYTSKW